jgi:hypothetical protein
MGETVMILAGDATSENNLVIATWCLAVITALHFLAEKTVHRGIANVYRVHVALGRIIYHHMFRIPFRYALDVAFVKRDRTPKGAANYLSD